MPKSKQSSPRTRRSREPDRSGLRWTDPAHLPGTVLSGVITACALKGEHEIAAHVVVIWWLHAQLVRMRSARRNAHAHVAALRTGQCAQPAPPLCATLLSAEELATL